MRVPKKKILKSTAIVFLTVMVLISLFFIFRQNILDQSIEKIKNKLNLVYQCDLQINSAEFEGFSNLKFNQITLIPQKKDTLIHIDFLETQISFFSLFRGKIQINKLKIEGGFLQGVKNQNGSNFESFLRKNKAVKTNEYNTKPDYAEKINPLLESLFLLIPVDLEVKNYGFLIKDFDNHVHLTCDTLSIQNKNIYGQMIISSEEKNQFLTVNGLLDSKAKTASIEVINQKEEPIFMPYLFKKMGLQASFEKLKFDLDEIKFKQGVLNIKGSSSMEKFSVNHPKIASKDVILNQASFDYQTSIGADYVQLDSTTVFQMNDLKINLFARFEKSFEKSYALKLKIPTISSQTFIESLPTGLFSNFEGMKATGTLAYQLDFKFSPATPETLVFEPKVTTNQLKIISFGQANLNKINHEFSYQAIENGMKQRAIWVGTENPNFTPLEQVSKLLESSVLTSEDPSFYQHAGFIQDAFKQSIQKNFEEHKFARGGSTISMQLVKNVFLTREKTLSRKIEEIMLVYLLEKNRIAAKSRMLEVYFNVIEWGPNVYGIGEASQFYFNKKPADLNLKESLFLASIVPRPKKFMYLFDSEGNLKKFAEEKNNFIKNLMLQRGLIQETDTLNYSQPLQLSANARSFL